MPEELQMEVRMEVCNIVQEAMIKVIPEKKKCKKAKWLLRRSYKQLRKEEKLKGKGEKERYIHLKAAFQ